MEIVTDFILKGSKITADGDWSHEIKSHLLLGRKVMTNLDSILKSRDITLLKKSKLWFFQYGFSHVWMWELDYKESWVLKNWCFWTVVLEKTLENPLDCKEIQPVHPKGNQSWILIGRTDTEAETPILWAPGGKNWLIGKDPDPGKDWRLEEKWVTEDKMVGWYHWLNGHQFNSGVWWTGRPGVLQSMRSQRVRHGWGMNWTEPDFALDIHGFIPFAQMLSLRDFFFPLHYVL